MLYGPELQWSDRLGGPTSRSAPPPVHPALGESQQQGDEDDPHARVHETRLGGAVAIHPYQQADPDQHEAGDEQPRHSGRLRRSVKRRTPFLKSSVDRASTFVTTPAAMPSSNERESSL